MPGQGPAETRQRVVTSGSDSRPARPLHRPAFVDLAEEGRRLRSEPEWRDGERNAVTVATTNRMRIVLTALRAGSELGNVEIDDTLTVQVMDGRLAVEIDGVDESLRAGQLATIEGAGSWRVAAETDSLVLLTSALATDVTKPDR
jgi:quercetin dioxygenase-like cupin family protein